LNEDCAAQKRTARNAGYPGSEFGSSARAPMANTRKASKKIQEQLHLFVFCQKALVKRPAIVLMTKLPGPTTIPLRSYGPITFLLTSKSGQTVANATTR